MFYGTGFFNTSLVNGAVSVHPTNLHQPRLTPPYNPTNFAMQPLLTYRPLRCHTALFGDIEVECQLFGGNDDGLDVAECPSPPQPSMRLLDAAGPVPVNLTLDSDATKKRQFTNTLLHFFYHKQAYAMHGPYPPMIPNRGTVNATVLVNPEEMRDVLVVPTWPAAGLYSDFDLKVSIEDDVAATTKRQVRWGSFGSTAAASPLYTAAPHCATQSPPHYHPPTPQPTS